MKFSTYLVLSGATAFYAQTLLAQTPSGQTYHPRVDAFFNSPDSFIQDTVIPNIEKNRKSNAQISFLDQAGKPVTGLTVSVKQIEHAFLWGSVPPFERSIGNNPMIIKLWRDIYNYGITEYKFKWAAIEAIQGVYNWTEADKVLETITASGAQLEFHFLAGYHPIGWFESLSTAEKAKAQRAFGLAAIERYKDKISNYQVFNESHYADGGPIKPIPRAEVFYNKADFFKEITAKYPNLNFGINDCFRWNVSTFPTPAQAKTMYPGIRFVGQHGHSPHTYWVTPKEIYGLYNPFKNSGVNIHIEEFGVIKEEGNILGGGSGPWTEAKMIDYYISTYATVFSHPAVGAFNQWGIGPDINRWTLNSLLDTLGNPLPAYAALKSLVRDKFMTQSTGLVDASGLFKYRGFRGQYEITIKKGSVIGTTQVTLGNSNLDFKLVLTEESGKYIIAGGIPLTLTDLGKQSLSKSRLLGPDITTEAGSPVQFTGLKDVRSLEIVNMHGTQVKVFEVIGDRILWDRTDSHGRLVSRGHYLVRALSFTGVTNVRRIKVL